MSDAKRPPRQGAAARGLGRGLSALLGEDSDAAAAGMLHGARNLPIELLHRGRFQPRRDFDAEQMRALADSIRAQGILQPLLARPHPERPGDYEILAGERRWRAAQLAQLTELPVLVRDISDREASEIALVENVQRQDLNPIEEARGYHRLIREFAHTQDDIARATGKSRPYIANLLRLLNLPDDVVALVEAGRLSAGHARALIGHERAAELAQAALRQGLTVRQVEALARRRPAVKSRARHGAKPSDPNLRALERELEGLTGLKAEIEDSNGAGTLTLRYSSLDQLDAFLALLRKAGRA